MTTRSAEKSVELFEARLKKNPASRIFSRLADAYREDGDLSKAIDACINGLQNHPDYVTGRLVLGRCYMDQEDFDKAIEEFKKICSVDRHNRVAIKMLAEIYYRMGLDQKADDLYSVLYKIDPLGSTTFKPGMQLPGDKDLFEILEIDDKIDASPEFYNSSNEENEQLESPTTVQPTVEQYETGPSFEDEELNNSTKNNDDNDKQIDDLYPDKTEEISGNDISSRMDDLFDNETLSDDMEQTGNNENMGEQSDYESESLQTADSSDTDVSGDDVSSRIGELFSESDEGIEQENDPDTISDSIISENEKVQSSQSDIAQSESEIDSSLINDVTEYVDENESDLSGQNDLSDDKDQFTTDSTSEFDETLQFDRSLIDKIRSGQDLSQSSDMTELEFDNLDLNNEIPVQETGKIIDYEEYSAAAFDELDLEKKDSMEESAIVDSTDSQNQDNLQEEEVNNWGSELLEPENHESDQSEKLDNLVIEENENAGSEMDIMVTEPSDEHVSGDDVAQHLDSLFSENDSEESIDLSDKELKIEGSVDNFIDNGINENGDENIPESHELSQDLTEDSNDHKKIEDYLDSGEFTVNDDSDSEISENSLPDFNSEIDDKIDSTENTLDNNTISDDIHSFESDLIDLQQNDSELIVDNVDLNLDDSSEETISQERISDNDIEQHIENIFPDSLQGGNSDSSKLEPEFSEDVLNTDDTDSNRYSENSSYEDDNLLLEQISGNDVAQQLDTIFSEDSDVKSEISDSFNENWVQANSDNLTQGSELADFDPVSFEDQNREIDNKNVEPEIGVNIYGEDTDSIDGPPTISGSDISKRLEEFFPGEDIFDVTESALIPDQQEHAEDYVTSGFYSISGQNAEASFDEDLSELDNIEIEGAFEEESVRNDSVNSKNPISQEKDVLDVSSDNMESMPGVISEIFDSPDLEEKTYEKLDKNKLQNSDLAEDTRKPTEYESPLSDNLESAKTEIIELNEKGKQQDKDESIIPPDNGKKTKQISKITETLEEMTEEIPKENNESNSKVIQKDNKLEKSSAKVSDLSNENVSDKQTQKNVSSEITGSEEVMQTVAELPPETVEENDSSFSIPDHVLTPTLADIYFHQGQTELAIQLYQRLIKRDPDNEKLQKRLEQIKASLDQDFVDTVFYPEPEKEKDHSESAKKERRKKKKFANDNRPLAGVRIKKHKKAGVAKRKKSS